jgi:uncharacterized protein
VSGLQLAWGGELLELRPERAVFLPRHGALLVADFHLGKAHSFRRAGLPVPGGSTQDNLARLDAALARVQATELIFLGDFLHAEPAQRSPGMAAFAAWRAARPALAITLVRGNHDRHAGDPPAELGFGLADEPLQRGGVALCHHPRRLPGLSVLAGHLHPAAVLWGRARDKLRLPCFHFTEGLGVLPAFGAFTGMHTVEPEPGSTRYVVDGERVFALPPVA